jgi:hypothetical protein
MTIAHVGQVKSLRNVASINIINNKKMSKIPKSIKFDVDTIEVIDALLLKPENLKLKNKFNPMVEHLIETHPDFIEQKKNMNKRKK